MVRGFGCCALWLTLAGCVYSADGLERPGWRLTFQDEFDGPALDKQKWSPQDPWGYERNNELQAYVPDAFELRDGILRIVAQRREASYAGKPRHFTSGMMSTYRKFAQQFGRFEIRCRVPRGKGLWPAFWLLPEPLGWPPEIDVLETLGHDTRTIHLTHHWNDAQGMHQSDGKSWQGEPDFASDFHVIAVEWSLESIRWEIDGIERFRSVKTVPTAKMYMLVNLAVGGDWPGSPDEKTVFPAALEVDWVRCYAKGQ